MLKNVLLLIALFLALPGLCSPGIAAEPTFEEVASRQLREATAGDVPGVAVLVARDGKIVFQGGFGMADVAKKEPITPATKFRIGSVSKQFTAAAILRLAEQGKLSLDDSLAKYYPDFPGAGDITLRQLLTHTSGMHSYTEKPEIFQRVPEFIEAAKLIEWFQNDKPDFAPGKGFHYSNSGYFLAGEIVGKVSGKPLGEYLRETFFEPLEMKDTGIYVNARPPAGMARGYAIADDKVEPALDWDMSWAGGAGAIYSTVGDLYRWNEGLFGGLVLSEATFKAATTPVALPEGIDGMNYGYGLMMFQVQRLPAVGHGGGLQGWSSDLLRLPEQRCTVVVLANSLAASAMNPSLISRKLAETVLAEEIAKLPPPVEDKSVDPKTFAAFAGRYDYTSAIMTVTVEEDGLYAQLTDQPKNRIFPKAKDTFFWKGVDAEVVFLRDDKGDVIAARHTQGGASTKVARLGEEKVKLTAEQVAAIVGKYQYGPGSVLTVTSDGTQLFGQLTGQPKLPIFPLSEAEFEWRAVAAKVEFVKDKEGNVTKALHRQNGATLEAPRVK